MSQSVNPDPVRLTISERLAADRTRFANERTFLAYVRTALGLIAAGTGFGNYLDSPLLRIVFILFIPIGVLILILGIVGFQRRKRVLQRYTGEPD